MTTSLTTKDYVPPFLTSRYHEPFAQFVVMKEILRKGITVDLKGNLSSRMREFYATGQMC